MNSFKKHLSGYPFALFFSLTTVGVVLLIYGFFWEDWEGLIAYVGYGLICTPPSHEVLLQDVLFLQFPLIIHLSNVFAQIPVFGIWRLAVIIIYVSLWFHLSIRILSRLVKGNIILQILFSHLFVWAIIVTALVYVNATRDSILLVSVSTLLYFDYYLIENKYKIQFILTTFLGIAMRVTSGVLALSTMTLLIFLFTRDVRKTFHLLKLQWGISILCLLFVEGFYPGARTYIRQLESYEYPIMGGALVPISQMKSKADSLRYEALCTYFLVTDTQKIDLKFISSIVDLHKFHEFIITEKDIFRMNDSLLPLFDKYKIIITAFYTLLFIISFNSTNPKKFNLILFNIYSWLVIFVLALKITIQAHFFVPWLEMVFACSLYGSLLSNIQLRQWQKQFGLFMLIIMIVFGATILKGDSIEEQSNNAKGYAHLKKLSQLPKDKILIIWDHSPQLPNDILARNQMCFLTNCIDLSFYSIQFYPFGQDRCKNKLGFNPLDWKSMNIYINKNQDHVKFITEESFSLFLQSYYRSVYNMNLTMVKDSPVNEMAPGLFSFHIESKTAKINN